MLPSSIMRTASDVLEMRGEREHKIQTAAVLYWNSFVCGCALLFPFGHFGLIAAVVLAIQYFSSRELRSILPHGGLRDPGTGMTIAGLVQSLAVYIACIFAENPFEPTVLLFFVSAVCLTIELAPLGLQKKPSFPELLKAAASIVFLHFYTALLPSLIMLIVAGFPEARDAIITFALLTFGNDSLAWLFGNYVGGKRNIVEVSPNKSIAGFVGGVLGSIIGAFWGSGCSPVYGSRLGGIIFS